MNHTATYSPDDNKLRLYAATRLDADTYARVKAAGFKWAPKQGLFVAPMWTPEREDLLLELAGRIDDEDRSLVDRAEERADRFARYSERRSTDAQRAADAVSAIADNIPLGQPILIGHHSERHARRDAAKIENGMRKAVRMWATSKYWTRRAAGAIAAAKYKERPDVRARRIKVLEADLRKYLRGKTTIANAERWIGHLENRLAYERAMLAETGYTPPPKAATKAVLPLLNYKEEVYERGSRPSSMRHGSRGFTPSRRYGASCRPGRP